MIAVIMIRLCKRYFLLLTAINPANNKAATIEFITALIFANKCSSKPSCTFSFTLLSTTTAAKTIIDTARIRILATLSFFFQTASSIFIPCFSQYNQKYSQPHQRKQKNNPDQFKLALKKASSHFIFFKHQQNNILRKLHEVFFFCGPVCSGISIFISWHSYHSIPVDQHHYIGMKK